MRTWGLHVSAYDLFRGQCLRALLLSLYHKLHTQAPVLIENITLDTITKITFEFEVYQLCNQSNNH